MTVWTCPDCERDFGAKGQGHDCRPGLTIDEYAAGALSGFREIYDRIEARLLGLDGDLIIDPIEKMVRRPSSPRSAVSRRAMTTTAPWFPTTSTSTSSEQVRGQV